MFSSCLVDAHCQCVDQQVQQSEMCVPRLTFRLKSFLRTVWLLPHCVWSTWSVSLYHQWCHQPVQHLFDENMWNLCLPNTSAKDTHRHRYNNINAMIPSLYWNCVMAMRWALHPQVLHGFIVSYRMNQTEAHNNQVYYITQAWQFLTAIFRISISDSKSSPGTLVANIDFKTNCKQQNLFLLVN